MLRNLREDKGERFGHSAFLCHFAVMGEVMKVNDGRSDGIFHTCGLEPYKDVPLMESLEYPGRYG